MSIHLLTPVLHSGANAHLPSTKAASGKLHLSLRRVWKVYGLDQSNHGPRHSAAQAGKQPGNKLNGFYALASWHICITADFHLAAS